ncbi:type I-F CRISPR-associated endoribonuclease Cas6/Csy4 [Methylomonas rivi]|uniref:Type I-F CRISPR-associated endoribonuclease Cas6/Csy4 n=1 Tax=Methylomonas rivi TaxID=2952226 RepID=A0ABT1U9K2_9GAMM|nr:type I-F CRISPR-associated endoribonuclease Cas6/Csy4 [Methylomonas sp. WSC-6]MCQ8130301.1 type I-F CRISPR-associated endoribonuclease Cas6/Csy4 [Methylomonas sp. WSC-6]
MKYYLEITLLPNEEIPIHFLWSKVFQQIHLGLVEMQDAKSRVPIGVSFPGHVANDQFTTLCSKLRLFAQDQATLVRFDAPKWLSRLSDYVHCTSIRPVPDKVAGYAIYRRERPKTNPERLARRYAKRHNLDFETALNGVVQLRADSNGGAVYPKSFRYCEMPIQRVTSPFIRLQSLSNGQSFCLWIKKIAVAEPSGGKFSSYGLSALTTVPEF